MIFSDFLKNVGSPLFEGKPSDYNFSTDITIDPNVYNVHRLNPTIESMVTVPDPDGETPINQVITNQGSYSLNVNVNGDDYSLKPEWTMLLNWTGIEWVVSLSGKSSEFMSIPPIGGTQYKIFADDGAAGDQFGQPVDIDGDGTRLIAGGPWNDGYSGSAYIFFWNGTSWTQEQKLLSGDIASSDHFGISVSMSSDGTRCICGVPNQDTNGNDAGAVYIFSRSGTTWTQEQKILASDGVAGDRFGRSVSMSSDGTRVISGAHGKDESGNDNAGAAYIFTRSGTTWTQEQKILASDIGVWQFFGYSIIMSGDGTRCVVGAYGDDTLNPESGAVYVFSRSGTTWTQEQKIVASFSDGTTSHFGLIVSMDINGNRFMATSNDNVAFAFVRSGTTWTQEQIITASDLIPVNRFGESLTLSNDGLRCVIGNYTDSTNGTGSGAIYIFDRNDTTWVEGDKLLADDGLPSDWFGRYIAISDDRSKVVVGATGDGTLGNEAGSVYIL